MKNLQEANIAADYIILVLKNLIFQFDAEVGHTYLRSARPFSTPLVICSIKSYLN